MNFSIEMARNSVFKRKADKTNNSDFKKATHNSKKVDLFCNGVKLLPSSVQGNKNVHCFGGRRNQRSNNLTVFKDLSNYPLKDTGKSSSYSRINSTPLADKDGTCLKNLSISPIESKDVSISLTKVREETDGLKVSNDFSEKQNQKNRIFFSIKESSSKKYKPLLIHEQYNNNSKSLPINKIDDDNDTTKVTPHKCSARSFGSKYLLKSSLRKKNVPSPSKAKLVTFSDTVITLTNSANGELIISEESIENLGHGNSIGSSHVKNVPKRKKKGLRKKRNARRNVDIIDCFENTKKKKMWDKFAHFFNF